MSTFTVRPLHDPESSTWTYILVDKDSEKAAIIDPVLEHVERDFRILKEMGVTLAYIMETHIHADHITAASSLKDKTGARIVYGSANYVDGADLLVADDEQIRMGKTNITALSTPGHTDGCTCYYTDGAVFTGDTLMIRKCGRTDFQNGSAEKLYDSVHAKLYTLPENTLVYPGHDYQGELYSTIGEEKKFNTRLKTDINKPQFVSIMNALKLDPPQKIKIAVPANERAGRLDKTA